MQFYRDGKFEVTSAASGQPDIVKIRVYGITGTFVTRKLIEASEALRETSDTPLPYEFAGRHQGMPHQEVWAITMDASPIEPHVGQIIESVVKTQADINVK